MLILTMSLNDIIKNSGEIFYITKFKYTFKYLMHLLPQWPIQWLPS